MDKLILKQQKQIKKKFKNNYTNITLYNIIDF
jgi:hypothetical protein